MKVLSFTVAATVGLLVIGMASPAVAGEKQTMAAGACKSALPVFDGNIRSRPLAVQNEGSSPAFVTCTQQGDFAEASTLIAIALINTGTSATTVNCTLVNHPLAPEYHAQSTSVPAGSTTTWVRFEPPGGNATFHVPFHAFSCSLPPGTGISRIAVVHMD